MQVQRHIFQYSTNQYQKWLSIHIITVMDRINDNWIFE